MPCLQPEIMIVDGLYQNRTDTAAIGAQGIGKDLVACQRAFLCVQSKLPQALADALGEGFLGMGDTFKPPFPAENLHPVIVGIGNHTELDLGSFRHL